MNPILRPLATGFRIGVALRHAAYRRGWFKTRRLNRPVISVGNLTVGGTGKTPLVAAIARILLKRGWSPSILTRGYGRRSRERLVLLEPGATRAVDARQCGDEPALLARWLPEVPIVICADRYRGGGLAEERFHVDVHLLDDGFQHVALARDLDIVVLDTTQELSDRALLPVGRQREPCSALKRADCVILTRVESGDPEPLEKRVRQINPRVMIFHGRTVLRSLMDARSRVPCPVEEVRRKPSIAFAGIGNPGAFLGDLRRWGFTVVKEEAFSDHHVYTGQDLEHLSLMARKAGAAVLLTTEKDVVNFPAHWETEVPVVVCSIQADIVEAESFEERLLTCLGAAAKVH